MLYQPENHILPLLLCAATVVLGTCNAGRAGFAAISCDNDLYSGIRLTHNRLIFTIPLDFHGQWDTQYIYFCSDDTPEDVSQRFYEKYKSMLTNVPPSSILTLLHQRKSIYERDQEHLNSWKAWDLEKNKILNIAQPKTNLGQPPTPSFPNIFHFLWLGTKPLPEYAAANMASWAKLHPNFKFMLWNNTNIRKLKLNEANSRLLQSLTDPRSLSDILRLQIVYEYGGIYIDMDIIPVKNIERLIPTNVSCFAFLESPDVVNNAIIGSSRKGQFVDRLLRDLADWAILHHGREAWQVTGPKFLTHAVRFFPSEIALYPSTHFNSIHFSMTKYLQALHKDNPLLVTLDVDGKTLNTGPSDALSSIGKCLNANEVSNAECMERHRLARSFDIYGFHMYDSRVQSLPTKLEFLPFEALQNSTRFQLEIKILPWRGSSDMPAGGLWYVCAQLLKYPSEERCSRFQINRVQFLVAVIEFMDLTEGTNHIRAWVTDGYRIPHASSSISTAVYVVSENFCSKKLETGTALVSNDTDLGQPYWCKTSNMVFRISLKTAGTMKTLNYSRLLGPLRSAYAFNAGLALAMSKSDVKQLATRLHLKMNPELHAALNRYVDEGFRLLEKKSFEKAKTIFLDAIRITNATFDAVAPHLKATALTGMLTYCKFAGDEYGFYRYLKLIKMVCPTDLVPMQVYGALLFETQRHEESIEVFEKLYEASIGPQPHIEAKTSLFKAYTWSSTKYGLSRALSLGSRLLEVHPSNLFMVVALSQFEKLQSAAYVTMHKWLCNNEIFCLLLDNNMNQHEEVGAIDYHSKRGKVLDECIQRIHTDEALQEYASSLAVVYMRLKKSYKWINGAFNAELDKYKKRLRLSTHNAGTSMNKQPIILIVEFFKPKSLVRENELLAAMWINVKNPYILEVHVFTQTSLLHSTLLKSMQMLCIAEFLSEQKCLKLLETKLMVEVLGERATFKHAIEHGQMSERHSGGFMIVANADIYFDDTLKYVAYNSRLTDSNDEIRNKKCYALLRHECIDGVPGENSTTKFNPRSDSQDAWIMPIPFEFNASEASFYFGKNGADNSIVQLFRNQGIHVSSPSTIIRSYHLHRSNGSRTYSNLDYVSIVGKTHINPFVRLTHVLY